MYSQYIELLINTKKIKKTDSKEMHETKIFF